MAYTPLYVLPVTLPDRPAPPSSSFATFFSPVLPRQPVTIGLPVHLHLLCFQPHALPARLPKNLDSVSIPIAVQGVIAGERARTETSVEFVVMNDLPGASIRRAFITLKFHPRYTPLPDLASMIARSIPAASREWRHNVAPLWPERSDPDVTARAPGTPPEAVDRAPTPRATRVDAMCGCLVCTRTPAPAVVTTPAAHTGIPTLAPQPRLPMWTAADTLTLLAAPHNEYLPPRPTMRPSIEWSNAGGNDGMTGLVGGGQENTGEHHNLSYSPPPSARYGPWY